jgi:hypothetical protein
MQEIDLIVGPISMTHDRDALLDFTYPFHIDKYGVLYKRIEPASTKWRLFMEPFKYVNFIVEKHEQSTIL